jgi:hypothetical protein
LPERKAANDFRYVSTLELEQCREFTTLLDEKRHGGRSSWKCTFATREQGAPRRVESDRHRRRKRSSGGGHRYSASTGYADARALKPVCAHEEDALEVVKGAT